MRLESKGLVNAPVDVVYRLVRDDLPKLVEHLPNISRIEVKERSEQGDRIRIVNHWYGKGEIPAMAQKFVKPDILSWKDTASWDDAARAVDYQLESFVASKLFSVKGRNAFAAAGDKTELTITCDMEIYPDQVPGVPRFLAGSIKPMVEEFIGRLLKPNLTSLADGLNRYFAAHR